MSLRLTDTERLSIIRTECLRLTNYLCDPERTQSELASGMPEWWDLIEAWKKLDNSRKIVYT